MATSSLQPASQRQQEFKDKEVVMVQKTVTEVQKTPLMETTWLCVQARTLCLCL